MSNQTEKPKAPGEPETVTIHVSSCPASLKKEIQELAKLDHRDMSGWILKKLEDAARAERQKAA